MTNLHIAHGIKHYFYKWQCFVHVFLFLATHEKHTAFLKVVCFSSGEEDDIQDHLVFLYAYSLPLIEHTSQWKSVCYNFFVHKANFHS